MFNFTGAALAGAILAFSTGIWASDISGKITGTLKDPAGNVVPQAAVAIANLATGVKQAALTDAQGVFAFPVVPVGTYALEVREESFQPYKEPASRSNWAAPSSWRLSWTLPSSRKA